MLRATAPDGRWRPRTMRHQFYRRLRELPAADRTSQRKPRRDDRGEGDVMADNSAIEWTDATWNPIVGCTILSPGCINCYAQDEAARQIRCAGGTGRDTHYAGTVKTVKGKPVWTGKLAMAPDHILLAP